MEKIVKYVKIIISAVFVLSLVQACSNDRVVYERVEELPEYGWDKGYAVAFDYVSSDTVGSYDIVVDLRNDASYRNQNFWLFVKSMSPDSLVYRDTLECVLADNYGKWIGKGSGTLKHLPVMLLENVKFPKVGHYKFELIQGMRYDTLVGIHDIGIRIIKKEEQKR